MKAIVNIYNKVLVREFYRSNVAFFALVSILTFGFMSGTEHRALAGFFVASPIILLIPIAVWFIYLLKVIQFNSQALARIENQFLYHLNLLSTLHLSLGWLWALVVQFIPAIAYATFLVLMAIESKTMLSVFLIVGVILVFLGLGTFLLCASSQRQHETKVTYFKKWIDQKFTKPIFQYYLEWLVRSELILFVSTKVFAMLLLFGVSTLYRNEAYDGRLLGMAITLVYSSNVMLILKIHNFDSKHFVWIKNLPIHAIKRAINFVIVFLVLTLPELSILTKHYPDNLNFGLFISLFLYANSIGLLFYGLFFLNKLQEENFMRVLFLLIILSIVLILFKVPIFMLALVNFVVGIVVINRYYYRFEGN